MNLAERVIRGDRVAAARVITLIESHSSQVPGIFRHIYKRVGRAYRVGVTGPPGAGKSTLVDRMTRKIRQEGKGVGIIAVDPTSPFSGGALLGDRVRMQHNILDEGVFIRSMASRGSLGGIAEATGDAADVLDALGMDYVLIETVGTGQSEVDVVEEADTTILILTPEGGDEIQTMKAGLMEIADIFVVNKADREGAERIISEINFILELKPPKGWRPPVVTTVAVRDEGTDTLMKALQAHREFMKKEGLFERHRKEDLREKVKRIVEHRLRRDLWGKGEHGELLEVLVEKIIRKEEDPYGAAEALLKRITSTG